MSYCYEYQRPALTADCVLIDIESNEVLLIQRKFSPFEGRWALPGGFVEKNELVEEAAIRELTEETGIDKVSLRLSNIYSKPDRDPRGWTITAAYLAVVKKEDLCFKAGDDARKADWFSLDDLPNLAFDHKDIIFESLKLLIRV